MSRITNIIKLILTDERGQLSAKRTLAFICTLNLCLVMLLNSVSHKTVSPSPDLVNAVMVIACTCIGSTAVDKFSYKKSDIDGQPDTTEDTTTSSEVTQRS